MTGLCNHNVKLNDFVSFVPAVFQLRDALKLSTKVEVALEGKKKPET